MMTPYFVGLRMLLRRISIIALVAASAAASSASAKNLRADDGPAEYPPQSYTANQYVDSRGCVYIRAGYAGQVTWVPRVSRDRKVLCGFKPSLAAGQAAEPDKTLAATPDGAAPKAQAAQAEKAPVAETKSAAPKVAAKPPAPVGKPMATVALTKTPPKAAAAAPAPAKPARTAAKPAVKAPAPAAERRVAREHVAACPGASEISGRYINDGSAGPVRCGPQAEAPAGRRAAPQKTAPRRVAAAPASNAPARVTVPRQAVSPAPVTIPAGYQPAWKDDRLNPMRGKGTAEGKAQMDLLWTETVPRRLIDVTTGHDVTAKMAHVDYPYTDYAMQQRHLGGAAPKTRVSASSKSVRVTKPQAPRAASGQAAASHRFVQVGMFGMPANAEATKVRLRALGLPVAVAKTRSKGRDLQIVFAGPFKSQAQLTSALGAVRKAGYGDAFLRK